MAQSSFLEELTTTTNSNTNNNVAIDSTSIAFGNQRLRAQASQDLSEFMKFKQIYNQLSPQNRDFEIVSIEENIVEINKIECPQIAIKFKSIHTEMKQSDYSHAGELEGVSLQLNRNHNHSNIKIDYNNLSCVYGTVYPIELEITYQYDDHIILPNVATPDVHAHNCCDNEHCDKKNNSNNKDSDNTKHETKDKDGDIDIGGICGISGNEETSDIIDYNDEFIHLRPRIRSVIEHINIEDTGILRPILFEDKIICEINKSKNSKNNNDAIELKWDSLLEVFESMIRVIKEPIIAMERMYPTDRIIQMWSLHDSSKKDSDFCKCQFYYALPCDYQTFKKCKSDEMKQQFVNAVRNKLKTNLIDRYIEQQIVINEAISSYQPIFPQLFGNNVDLSKFLDQNFLNFWNLMIANNNNNSNNNGRYASKGWKTAENRDKFIKDLCKVEIKDKVFSFPLFNNQFCEMIYKELENYEKTDNLPKLRPNSMNNYGVILNYIGLKPLVDALFKQYLHPIAMLLLGINLNDVANNTNNIHNANNADIYNNGFYWKNDTFYDTLDAHHTFMVEYEMGADLSLDMHIDDSEVTFNINILDDFTGADLAICGYHGSSSHREKDRSDPDRAWQIRKHLLNYSHQKGRCLVHSGKQRHGALPITSGKRCNLIVWCRSSLKRETIGGRDRVIENYQKEMEMQSKSENNIYDSNEKLPDIVCLSRTHDTDYDYWIKQRKENSVVNDIGHEMINDSRLTDNNPLL